jgi:hypothetical protein
MSYSHQNGVIQLSVFPLDPRNCLPQERRIVDVILQIPEMIYRP